MTDQQRWDALGSVDPQVKTPNLDRLAREGISFRQTVSQCPMCVPSRYSMMLGRYAFQTGVLTNADAIIEDRDLPGDTLAERFRKAGWQTAGFGKTHWGHAKETQHPSRRGFDVRAIGQPRQSALYEEGACMMDDEAPEKLAGYFRETDPYGPGEEEVPGYIGCTSAIPNGWHRDGWVADKCLDFIRNDIDSERPLFLYLSFLKPHAGFNVPKEFEDLYRLEDIPLTPQPPWEQEQNTHLACGNTPWLDRRYERWRAAWEKMSDDERKRTTLRYWANCSWLDHYFGQVLDALAARGILDNALIVFTSDHGDMMGERNYRFSKYCLYDSSVRVPLILSGAAVPENLRGTESSRPAELIDLLPTLSIAAGLPGDSSLPGENLFEPSTRTGSFSEYHGSGVDPENSAPAVMWRTSEWKLILYSKGFASSPGPCRGELYNLKNDPYEWHNLYANEKYKKIRDSLFRQLCLYLSDNDAEFPMFGK